MNLGEQFCSMVRDLKASSEILVSHRGFWAIPIVAGAASAKATAGRLRAVVGAGSLRVRVRAWARCLRAGCKWDVRATF